MIILASDHKSPHFKLPWFPFGWEVLRSEHDYWFHLVTFNSEGKVTIVAKCSVFMSLDDSHATLENVFVPLAHRGHGYAQCLIKYIISVLPCNNICAKVAAANTSANKTFEKVFGAPVETASGQVMYCYVRPPPFSENCL